MILFVAVGGGVLVDAVLAFGSCALAVPAPEFGRVSLLDPLVVPTVGAETG